MTASEPSDASTAPATTRKPLPSAPRCGRRSNLLERIGRRMENRLAISSGVPSRPGPLSSMKVQVFGVGNKPPDHPTAGVERVIGNLLHDQPPQPPLWNARFLLQAFHGPEQCPVLALGHLQNRPVFVSALTCIGAGSARGHPDSLTFQACRLSVS